MYNQYVDQQVDTFERRQRERQAEMQRMAKSIKSDRPRILATIAQVIARIGHSQRDGEMTFQYKSER